MRYELTTQEISNLSWALAKFSSLHAPLCDVLAAQAMHHIEVLNRQELSVTAWSFATLALCHRPLLQAIAAQSLARIDDFGALEISNPAWAFAKLAFCNEPLMTAIAAAAQAKFQLAEDKPADPSGLVPNGVYSIVWSAWRTTKPALARSLAQPAAIGGTGIVEVLVHGLLVMDNEWGRGDPWGHQARMPL